MALGKQLANTHEAAAQVDGIFWAKITQYSCIKKEIKNSSQEKRNLSVTSTTKGFGSDVLGEIGRDLGHN